MLPQVKSGDYMLLFTWRFIAPRPKYQVIFKHPNFGILLKSVVNIDRKKSIFSAQGQNLLSIETGNLKNMPLDCLIGIVIWQFKR